MSFETVSRGERPIGAYEVLFELGRGGMGVAHLARVVGPGGFERLVVVKRLHPHLLERADVVGRFLDEARLAACVGHANVVSTHQVGHDERGYFLVLDYVEGLSLEELSDRAALKGETVALSVSLRIALDALAGLDAAYNARDSAGRRLELLHRDVSLQNILVGRDGVARVVDFGIAKSAQGSVVTAEGFVLGKLVYMPPEYLRHQPLGPDFDVYSLGVTLWMLLAGREPWPGAEDAQIVAEVLERGLPRLSSAAKVPPQIDELLARACATDRGARFGSAAEMSEAIEAVGRETGWVASHREVAELVERLAGRELERRRERIAQRDRELAQPTPTSSNGGAGEGTYAIPLARVASGKGAARSARARWAVLAVLGASALVGVGLAWRDARTAATAASFAATPELPHPAALASAPASPATEPVPAPAPAPSSEPSVRPAPSSSEPAAPRSAATRAPSPASSKPLSDRISKKNPYRD